MKVPAGLWYNQQNIHRHEPLGFTKRLGSCRAVLQLSDRVTRLRLVRWLLNICISAVIGQRVDQTLSDEHGGRTYRVGIQSAAAVGAKVAAETIAPTRIDFASTPQSPPVLLNGCGVTRLYIAQRTAPEAYDQLLLSR